jgi:outer membrane lipoprotein
MRICRLVPALLASCLMLFQSGCAHVIASNLRMQVPKDLTFAAVLKDPDRFRGEMVIWGGRIIETVNEEGYTRIKVLQIPLDFTGFPEDEEASEGRFLVQVIGYVDPEIYRKGRFITLAAIILGSRREPLGAIEYEYPLLESRQIHLWKNSPGYGVYPAPYWPWYDGNIPYLWPYHRPSLAF